VAVGLKFTGDWRTTLFALVMVPLLAALGFWQLSRADEKNAIAAAFEAKQHQPPALLQDLESRSAQELAYQRVMLTGTFQPQYFLLDNRTVNGRYGNEVIGVLEVRDTGELALVNRGWVAADAARRSLPDVPPIKGEVSISGQVYVSPGKPYLLAQEELASGWPKRIQAVEVDKLAAAIGRPSAQVFPYPVRIDANEKGALYVDWPVVNASPAKHYGYAVQWFAMSVVLALLYLLRSTNLLQVLRETGRRENRT
jgi:cytochrome oxidase assembly protein ShyY1